MTPLTYHVADCDDELTLNDIVRARLHLSRTLVVKLKQQHKILVNGAPEYTNFRVSPGDLVTVDLDLSEDNEVIPAALPIEVVYEDEDILVVNKPPGMAIHPARQGEQDTLANAVTYYWQQSGSKALFRPVNRLDKETSGLVLIAHSKFAHQALFRQQKKREVERIYLALVDGVITPDEGRINEPIIRLDPGKRQRSVDPQGQQAVTVYQVMHRYENQTLLRLKLETGRTHQIRVHLSYIGHPVCGDTLYGCPSTIIERQALHAGKLSFTQPRSGQRLHLQAPLPEDLLMAIRTLELTT